MNKRLFTFQDEGARFLAKHSHALLADQPGLGKTVQALSAMERLGLRKNLVICPASVRLNWFQEAEECWGHTAGLHVMSYNGASARDGKYPITLHEKYDSITLDEGQFLQTIDSQRTQAIFKNDGGLARRANYKWVLSGTPMRNRPRDFYPVLKTLCPAFKDYNFARYAQEFCGAYFDGRGLNTKGATRLDQFSEMLHGFMLRRTKAEAFPGRKEPLIHRIPMDVTEIDLKAVYAEEELILARESKASPRAEDYSQLGDTSRLLRLTGQAKVRSVAAFCRDLLGTVEKIVVFAYHREVIKDLEETFTLSGFGPLVYHGGMSDGAKSEAVEAFKKESNRIFIGQRQAAGTGINGLQDVCSTAVIAEPSWVPTDTEQMIDRLDRMGQNAELVTAYICYAAKTLEAAVIRVHDGKDTVIKRAIGDNLKSN